VAESDEPGRLRSLYCHRFDSRALEGKNRLWKVLCEGFFQRYVKGPMVVDVGAGACEFINNIRAPQKIAVDLNPDTRTFAAAGVSVFLSGAERMPFLPSGGADTVFMSNLLEHMKDKTRVMEVLEEARRILRPGGRVLILQPNVRFVGEAYWNFFDHHVPLSDKSLAEAVRSAGFGIRLLIPAFLPYTTKSRLPQWGWIVRLYLKIPLLWRFFGKQTFLIGEKV
jgi:SAM-dependent methyltransferase